MTMTRPPRCKGRMVRARRRSSSEIRGQLCWNPVRTAKEPRELIVQALEDARGERGLVEGTRTAQMTYLRNLRNSKNLREIVWEGLIAVGQAPRQQQGDGHEKEKESRETTSRAPGRPLVKERASPSEAHATNKKPQKSLEARLWDAADALRGNQEPSEYKHVVLGLVFLKYISDRFEERRRVIEASLSDPHSDDYIPNAARRAQFVEDRDEYTSHNVFWVPAEARWEHLLHAHAGVMSSVRAARRAFKR